MDLTIRDARADDGAAIASLLGQLGYETDPGAVAPRLERLVIVGDRVVVASAVDVVERNLQPLGQLLDGLAVRNPVVVAAP